MKQKIKFLALFIVFGGVLCAQQSRAAFDIYMQIPEIKGESMALNRKDWIDVFSFHHSITNSQRVSPGGVTEPGTPGHAEFVIQKRVDISTPPVNLELNRGKEFPKITVDFVTRGETPTVFYKVELEDVVITSVASHGAAGDDRIYESVGLTYAKITWTYWTIDSKTGKAGGSSQSFWDLRTPEVE